MRQPRRNQAQWESYCTADLPGDIATAVVRHARTLYPAICPPETSPVAPMNQRLNEHRRAFRSSNIRRAYDSQAIRDYAENRATLCRHIEPTWPTLTEQFRCLERRQQIAYTAGIAPPEDRNYTLEGRLKRLETPKWWRRQFKKSWTRGAENQCRDIGLIRRGEQPYVTDAAVRHQQTQQAKAWQYLAAHELLNECAEQLSLFEVAQHSLANVQIRRGELMTRARGFQELADQLGHKEVMATLTAPSAFHAQLKDGGANTRFQHTLVREAQRWLSKMWARARAFFKRKGVMLYGFRVAEPHHDATPHWHMVLYGRAQHLELAGEYVRRCWLAEYAHEPGAAEHRIKWETADPAKGNGVGYIAKYIAKNIDGAGRIGAETDLETGTDIHDSTVRVRTWASLHGIRQFQQIGGPAVGLWREARKLRKPTQDEDINQVAAAADHGNWCRFIFNVGGIHAGRSTNIKLRKEETGRENQYGELIGAQIVGLQYASSIVITRPHLWRIRKCQSRLSLASPPPQRAQQDFRSAIGLASSADSAFGPTITTLKTLQHCLASISPNQARQIPPPGTEFSELQSDSHSHLGPVAITVREFQARWAWGPDGRAVLRWERAKRQDSS